VLANAAFIVLALLLQNIGILWLMAIILSVATVLSFYLEYLVRRSNYPVAETSRKKQKNRQEKISI
jgi:hypothetical protein